MMRCTKCTKEIEPPLEYPKDNAEPPSGWVLKTYPNRTTTYLPFCSTCFQGPETPLPPYPEPPAPPPPTTQVPARTFRVRGFGERGP